MATTREPSADPPAPAVADVTPVSDGDFAALADAAPVPMWVTHADGSRAFVNRAYCALVGLPPAQALLLDWRTLIHPDDAEAARSATEAGVAAGGSFSVEARYRGADGALRWLRSVSQPRRDADGAVVGYVGVAHDVTEAKAAELALRAREAQLSALIDQTSAGLAQSDLTGRFTLVNDRFCEIVGRSRDDLLRVSMQDITHPDDLPGNLPLFAAAVRDGHPYAIEKRYLRPDGSSIWVSNSVAVIRHPDGVPYGVLAVTLDITARREAQAAVAANGARLEFLDALSRATAIATDADAVLTITTRMLGEQLGASHCTYADMDEDDDRFHIRGDWHAAAVPSIVGSYSLAKFGERAVAQLRGGAPLIVTDLTDPGSGAAAVLDLGIRTTICVPLIKGGKLAALMAVYDKVPRRWSEAEVSLVRDVAERSWAHVERVRAEAALRDSERQLRLAIDGARIGTWEQDLRTGRGHWSPRTAEIMGVPHDRPLSEVERTALIHPDDRERMARGTARLAREGSDFAIEHRVLRHDGSVRWVASHGVVVRDDQGRVARAIGTVRDVTARREAQEALTRLNRTLEAQVAERTAERDRMWRLSHDLFLVVDNRRRVRAVNPAIAGLGYRPDQVVGRTLGSFVHPEDRAAANAAMRRAAVEAIGEFHARLRNVAGDWRQFSWSAAPGDGEAYAIGRDVTAEAARRDELAHAQEALRQAQKMESLGELTGGVAHDFNNLLTPILGGLDMLSRDEALPERRRRLVRGALESAERARVLVQRLLAFARRQPLQPGPVDVAALLAGLRDLLASTVGPEVVLALPVAPDLPPALADANQLELALLNLAVNARDAMPDGGRLTISAIPVDDPPDLLPGRYVAISVADSGQGMDADTLARAIEPFFSTKGVGKGTGLGLSMVHGLASQLGGEMRIDSRPGLGTRVALLLPVADAHAPAVAPSPDAPVRHAGRVLLVDDEVAVRDAAAEMLRSLGFEVVTAASGEEALARLNGVDVLVTDHLMPGMKGADLARLARARHPALKLLIVSGYAALDEIPPELPRLAKPFRIDELAERLGSLA